MIDLLPFWRKKKDWFVY